MTEASPVRWHLAHTTWFFETFVLKRMDQQYELFDPAYEVLFNSYYNAVGEQFPRPQRGLLTRPTVREVYAYRSAIDERMQKAFESGLDEQLLGIVEIGLHHEQQHQELLLTDLKHAFSFNPLHPVYRETESMAATEPEPAEWRRFDEGIYWIGHEAAQEESPAFAYDNEGPRHKAYLQGFELSDRLVTNAEYLGFIADGGYRDPRWWLSEGWAVVNERKWEHPLYWRRRGDDWFIMTLSGLRPLEPAAPVCHVSYYEADAFAAWAGCRLPREEEWEVAARDLVMRGNFVESELYHPVATDEGADQSALRQCFGDVWEWTMSPYAPYPGFKAAEGALGEYNGKFMCNQYVLRGGSCATSASHIRPTYRNFFPADARWQFSGIRLAKDAS
jgi:ergothioneine biosynthesis protein EgtB